MPEVKKNKGVDRKEIFLESVVNPRCSPSSMCPAPVHECNSIVTPSLMFTDS